MITRLRNQLPDRNPRLWEDPSRALLGKIRLEFYRRIQPREFDTAHVTDLSKKVIRYPLRMEIVPRDTVGGTILVYGSWEIPGTRFFQAFLRRGMAVADVGAHIGYYSILAGVLVGAEGIVYAFEPNPHVRRHLNRNVDLNRLEGTIEVYPMAVARRSGEIEFFLTVIPENTGTSSLIPSKSTSDHGTRVTAVSLDDFFSGPTSRERPVPDLIKIDVEDAEESVFEGARDLLSASKGPTLFFESRSEFRVAKRLEDFAYETRRLAYDRATGLRFVPLHEPCDSPYNYYDAPSFVSLKRGAVHTFQDLEENSRRLLAGGPSVPFRVSVEARRRQNPRQYIPRPCW